TWWAGEPQPPVEPTCPALVAWNFSAEKTAALAPCAITAMRCGRKSTAPARRSLNCVSMPSTRATAEASIVMFDGLRSGADLVIGLKQNFAGLRAEHGARDQLDGLTQHLRRELAELDGERDTGGRDLRHRAVV